MVDAKKKIAFQKKIKAEPNVRRNEILKIAAEVLAEKGCASATVRDIAKASGILSGSLYHHFKSKDEIIFIILSEVFEEFKSGYENIQNESQDPVQVLQNLVIFGFTALDRWNSELQILQNDFGFLSRLPEFRFLVDGSDEIEATWIKSISGGIEKGVFRGDLDARFAYQMMIGSIVSASRWYRSGGKLSAIEVGKHHANFFLNGLLKS